MRNTLFIQLLDIAGERISWLVVGNDGEPTGDVQHGAWSACADAATPRDCVLVAPATAVTLMHAEVPARNRKQQLKALPYALEDHLLDDVDTLFFAAGPREGNASVNVAVVAKRLMSDWIARAKMGGLHVLAVIPAVLTLPLRPAEWTLLATDELCMVRTGDRQGFVAERENLSGILRSALDEASTDAPVRLRVLENFNARDHAEFLSALATINCELLWESGESQVLRTLHKGFNARRSINLLQGEFDQRPRPAQRWRAWRPVAVLAAILVVAQLSTLVYERHALRQQSASLDATINATLRATFPEIGRVVNARVQMQQRLARLEQHQSGNGDGFLDLLARCGPILKAAGTVSLNSIDYRDRQLELDLAAADIVTLDRLKRALESNGIRVEIRSATARKNGVVGRLRILGTIS